MTCDPARHQEAIELFFGFILRKLLYHPSLHEPSGRQNVKENQCLPKTTNQVAKTNVKM